MGSMTSVTSSADKQGQSKPPSRWFMRPFFLGVVLVAATVALYYPVNHHPFVNYDDTVYVTNNLHVQAGLDWDTVRWAFTTYDQANWHPLTWLSHALDCQLFELNPAGHHDVNLLLHVLNVLLLFWVLQQATGYAGRSFMVAALFAVHPLNVESVAWVAERKNVLCMFFFLLALAAYGWYVRRPGIVRYIFVWLLFAFGLMSKPMVITFPFVLLLLDYWPLGRLRRLEPPTATELRSVGQPRAARGFGNTACYPTWKLCLEKLPLLTMSAGSAVIDRKST